MPGPQDILDADRDRAVAQAAPFACGDDERRGRGEALLLHGLTGTPYEIRPFARGLYDAGLAVRAPLLPGHDDLDGLARARWGDWYDAAGAALDQAKRAPGPTLVLGFSMGALLALRLAAERPADIQALVVVAPPLALPWWQRGVIRALALLADEPRFTHLTPRLLGPRLAAALARLPKGVPDVRSAREARRNPGLTAFPFPTLREFLALQAQVRACLPMVRAPLLIVHGRLDHTAKLAHARTLAQAVASPQVEQVILDRSFHLVGRDLERARAVQAVVDFARRTMGSPPPHAPHDTPP